MHNELNEEYIAQVRLKISTERFSAKILEDAWQYIGLARRHRGQGHKRLRYYKDPIALGAVRKTMVVDGMTRNWYEYVPAECTPDKKWPLVVVMHGRGGSAETFFDMSGMSVVAEARRFIAVFPEAGIHQQKKNGLKNVLLWCGIYEGKPLDDISFIRKMVADIETRLPIDHGRIYACGQSSGGMMSDMLAYSASDLFAATASWSALRSPSRMYTTYKESAPLTPTMFLYGDRDNICAGDEFDSALQLALESETHDIIMEKVKKYHLDLSKLQKWDTYPISWRLFPNDQGVPMLVIGAVDNMVHANYPEESWISYDQFLSKFSRNENGDLCYCGKRVEKKR
jgi:predicted esterase